jgi:hypothetical protein
LLSFDACVNRSTEAIKAAAQKEGLDYERYAKRFTFAIAAFGSGNDPAARAGKREKSLGPRPPERPTKKKAATPSSTTSPQASSPQRSRAEPTVLSVTTDGLPSGWSREVRRSSDGKVIVYFTSPNNICVR